MKLVEKIILGSLTVSLLISFNACSDGGTTPSATSLSPVTTSGTAVDGYISGGTACLDLNKNNTCDAGEPSATTGAKGTFSLIATAAHQTHDNYETAPVIVYGGTDIDTDKEFVGVMKANYNASSTPQIVSPLTTMVKAVMDSGKTEEEAKTAVAKALNISVDDVLEDPFTTPSITRAALTVQKTLEVLAQANITADPTSSTSAAFDTIYAQLADATVAVSQSTGTKSFASIVIDANTTGKLTGGAASSAGAATVIESAITDSNLSGPDLALVTDSQIEKIKDSVISNNAVVTETEAQAATDDAEQNIRVIKATQILDGINATTVQKETILAYSGIIALVSPEATAEITKESIAKIIRESTGDSTLISLANTLDPIETPDECQNVNPITGGCEDVA